MRSSLRRAAVVIFVVLVVLVVPLVWSVSRPPRIEALYPQSDGVNNELEIIGRHFGDERGQSTITVGNHVLIASSYLEWGDQRIRVQVGDRNGLVYVNSDRQRSNGILFVNNTLPHQVIPANTTGTAPVVYEVEAPLVAVGRELTIDGRRFGANRGNGDVLFGWGSEQGDVGHIRPEDLDYVLWSERQIRVYVPDGAQSGALMVATDWGSSEPYFIEIERPVGGTLFDSQRSVAVSYGVAHR